MNRKAIVFFIFTILFCFGLKHQVSFAAELHWAGPYADSYIYFENYKLDGVNPNRGYSGEEFEADGKTLLRERSVLQTAF